MNSEEYLKIYTPRTKLELENQRDSSKRTFKKNEILLQVEGGNGTVLCVRGKYPNDAYFATVNKSRLIEGEN